MNPWSKREIFFMPIVVRLDVLLAQRKMKLTELREKIDVTYANLSILKNGHAKRIALSRLDGICKVLQCQPGDILEYVSEEEWQALTRKT
jgi:putative transcriptional regulator